MRFRALKYFFFILGFSACAFLSRGQSDDALRQWADDIASTYAGEVETEDVSLLVEDLLSLARSPFNINTAGREQLERVFFLSDIQVENILFRRYVNGPFYSVYELQAVEGLPVHTIKLLQPLVYFGETGGEKPSFRVWGDSFLRSEYQLEKSKGFKQDNDSVSAFIGDPLKLYSRTEVETNHGLSGGFIAEKDPGEPMFNKYISGLDMMTGYLQYENRDHWLREAGIGQYRASAGQGLVLQSGMPSRKSSMTTSIRNRRASFRPSLSAAEASGLRGGYVTIGKGRVEVTPFFSSRGKDGRGGTDHCITSLKEDGLHRTGTEIDQRHNVNERVIGSKMAYSGKWLNLEIGHSLYQLDRPSCPVEHPYNQFYFRGKEVENSWVAYMMGQKNLLFYGELAFDDFSSMAAINGLLWGAAPGFSMALGHRSIEVDYRAPLAGPMTESSSFSGEQGIYTGINWEMPRDLTFSSYFDAYRFRWLKYRVDAPSGGFDWLGQLEKRFDRETSLKLRYRHREKPAGNSEEKKEAILEKDIYNQTRIQYRQSISPGFQFTTLGQWHFVKTDNQKERGSMLAQDVKWISQDEKLTLTARYALFKSTNYLARLYAYEPHVLYMFSVPAYSGTGSRYLFLANYKALRNLHLWLRAARWHYSDREEVGSGHNTIEGNVKTSITFQMRVKF